MAGGMAAALVGEPAEVAKSARALSAAIALASSSSSACASSSQQYPMIMSSAVTKTSVVASRRQSVRACFSHTAPER